MDKLWHQIQTELKKEMGSAAFQTFFGATKLLNITENKAIIVFPNKYLLDINIKRYHTKLEEIVNRFSPHKVTLDYQIDESLSQKDSSPLESTPLFSPTTQEIEVRRDHNLNPRYTFANLIVGNSNNFAYAAAQGIVANPGTSYNPFFIWGGTGVGKTHLMQAIGHELQKKFPTMKIKYFPSETFTSDLYNALRSKSMNTFKEKYRSLDCILVDDIQFIAGKEYTQEEFFHTFNALHMAGKQVILTSDRKPSDINNLEDRLVSRFMGGLTVDIQLPDFEMRVSILKQKAEEKNIKITPEAITALAEQAAGSIRDLEGRLQEAAVRAIAKGAGEVSLETLELVPTSSAEKFSTNTNPRHIISMCAKNFNIKTGDLIGKSRRADLAKARHITAYLLLTVGNLPLQEVGELLGGRDHTSIMHARDKISRELSTNPQLQILIHQIQSSF